MRVLLSCNHSGNVDEKITSCASFFHEEGKNNYYFIFLCICSLCLHCRSSSIQPLALEILENIQFCLTRQGQNYEYMISERNFNAEKRKRD